MKERLITHNGVTKNISEWAVHVGINASCLRYRLRKWPLDAALTPKPEADDMGTVLNPKLVAVVKCIQDGCVTTSDVANALGYSSKYEARNNLSLLRSYGILEAYGTDARKGYRVISTEFISGRRTSAQEARSRDPLRNKDKSIRVDPLKLMDEALKQSRG